MIASLFLKFASITAVLLASIQVTAAVVNDSSTKIVNQGKNPRWKTLRLVHAVFRHGERTPADTYPFDPYVNYTWKPYGWGQLTNVGKRHQYEIGKFIRKRYNGFLDLLYSPEKVTFWSTDVDRTKMSAQLVAAALYKPVGTQQWHKRLDWQPIPIHAESLNEDQLLLVRKVCPRYHMERMKIMNSTLVRQEFENYKNTFDYLSQNTGMVIQDLDDVQSIYSTLKAEEDFGVSLPDWTSKVYPTKLAHITARSFILNAYNEQMKKLKGGPLLKKILDDSKFKMTKNSNHQLYSYAGHDSTLANLLITLGVWDEQIPTYNMLALLELHETVKGHFYFKVFLRNDTSLNPYRLTIPGCRESKCSIKHFEAIYQNVLPKNLNEECNCTTQQCVNIKILDKGP
ncbi:prostatic acid phosphatase-like isoform X2 [Adelges cooleyi]|uniref:prostatic acid phosphatase-like isoform X2 n=1 Tax=Adelges cooleyi TaxID=133065 RepID=UPI00217F354C|nr:prostatic acid phosphatase-like isoform X2 [Adelges cooleyi]